jgi:hypothetical protein
MRIYTQADGPKEGCPRSPSLQNCKTAGFFSLNSPLAANACKCAGISGGCFPLYDSRREKLHICSNCVPEAALSSESLQKRRNFSITGTLAPQIIGNLMVPP